MTPAKLLADRHHEVLRGPLGGALGLEPAQWFHHSLARERVRADRSGGEFALLMFTPRDLRNARKTNARLARALRRRLRGADEAGWFDDERIAVILPGTSAGGAWDLADDVCQTFPLRSNPPLCEVFVYPADWMSDGGESEGRAVRRLESVFVRPLPAWKRALDVFGAAISVLFFAPLLLLVAALIKLDSRGPVLFRQLRTGRGGKRFVIYKFRSMVADAEEQKVSLLEFNEQDGPAFKIKSDPRLTRVGRWLRSTSIDEFPQLWNVLRGEMSLVGPRPLPCHESDACEGWQRRRLDVTPGLTCIWQVRGRSRVSFDEWMRMDLQYVDSCSIWQDAKLLLATVWAVLRGTGAH